MNLTLENVQERLVDADSCCSCGSQLVTETETEMQGWPSKSVCAEATLAAFLKSEAIEDCLGVCSCCDTVL